jgi:hypothetical protein
MLIPLFREKKVGRTKNKKLAERNGLSNTSAVYRSIGSTVLRWFNKIIKNNKCLDNLKYNSKCLKCLQDH